MKKTFNHVVQPTTAYNTVEILASEVDKAFQSVDNTLFRDDNKTASITSSIGDLDNSYIKEYVKDRGYIYNYSQQLYFPDNSQDAVLDLFPATTDADINNISISSSKNPSNTYTYKKDGILNQNTDYTFTGRKVSFGFPPTSDETLTINYKGFNTTTPDNSSFDLRYNVLRYKDSLGNTTTSFPAQLDGSTYSIFNIDLKDYLSDKLLNVLNNSPSDMDKYLAFYTDSKRINTSDINITRTFISFSSTDSIDVSKGITIYAANSSLADLIGGLFKLFYSHNHGSDGGRGVNHGDVLGLYKNTDKIKYLSPNKDNYDHPQYFNREGYVEDSTVYNNSILGDILLSSSTSANRYNNLDTDSVKLIFGEYSSGHKMYYSKSEDSLIIDSISKSGVKLVAPSNKDVLAVNEHSFVDTTQQSSTTNNVLKLKLATNNTNYGVLQLTRKKVEDSVEKEDDYALLLTYAIETSNITLDKQFILKDGAFLSFGEDTQQSTIKRTGNSLVFDTQAVDGRVIFNSPVTTTNFRSAHIDADMVHITDTQKIGFGFNDDKGIYPPQYINYENNVLNFKTTKSVRLQSTGRKIGLSYNDRSYTYVATPTGNSPASDTDTTDLYIESERDVYFLRRDYTFYDGTSSLQTDATKCNIYAASTNSSNFNLNYDQNSINGISFNADNKIFTQKSVDSTYPMIVKTPHGLVSATNYDINTKAITYGNITGSQIYALGDSKSTSGFYGNVIINPENKLTINGDVLFNTEIAFGQTVNFTKKLNSANIVSDIITAKTLTVTDTSNYNIISCNTLTANTELNFSTMNQTNRFATSTFQGSVVFNNNVTIPTNYYSFTLGSTDIEDNRRVSGLRLTSTNVRLGTGGLIESGKYLAGKGTPSGKGDRTGGYSFATTNGEAVGDTGFFCENNIEATTGGDLVFRIDGVEKGRLLKDGLDLTSGSITGKEKTIITADQLFSSVESIRADVLQRIYPIGTIYQNSSDGRNPSVILNWSTSTWRRYAIGRSVIGAAGYGNGEAPDSSLTIPSDLTLTTAGTKYGEYKHKLTTDEIPAHDHTPNGVYNKLVARAKDVQDQLGFNGINSGLTSNGYDNSVPEAEIMAGGFSQPYWDKSVIASVGRDKAHNITQPVIVTHIWERIN